MKFFMKLFKALNSAQTPWQVTLAMSLGMVAGLTPVSGIQSIIILLLVFVLNIHLGLFFVASGFFAGIGYIFDPWFEKIGYVVLTSDSLKGLWTIWYNSDLLRMSYFNNSLVMGSTVAALILAVPLYFLLGWMIHRYRDVLSGVLGRYPRLGLFGILKAVEVKDPLFRWWGAGLFGTVAVLAGVISLVMIDPLVKWGLESGGSKVLQRDVRIGDVDVKLSEGSIAIKRIEVAGEQKNIDALSIEQVSFDIGLKALLMNRTHIETVGITGVGFDTPATLSKPPAVPAKATAKATGKTTIALPGFALPTPESILANADLQSVKVYNESRKELGAILSKWQNVAQTDLSADGLAELQQDFTTLRDKSGSKDPVQLMELAGEVSAFTDKVKAQQQRITSLKESFAGDQKRIQQLYRNMAQASDADYNQLQSAYSLDGDGAMNVIGLLFSEKIKTYLSRAERYYTMVAPYLASEPTPPVPPRGEGRWLKFPLTVATPNLWIGKTEIGGILNQQSFVARIDDISDNQKLLGRPLRFSATSDGPQIRKLVVQGEDNRIGQSVLDSVTFASQGVRLGGLAFDALQIDQCRMGFKGQISLTGMRGLRGNTTLAFSETAMTMRGEDETTKILADILRSVKAFQVGVTLGGTLQEPQIGVSSDLDKQLAKGIIAGVAQQATAYKTELKGLLADKTAGQLGALKGEAGGLADINGLANDQNKALGGLSSEAGSLLKSGGVGGALKGLKLF